MKLYLEENVVESPSLGGQNGGHAFLSLLDEVRDIHCPGTGITGCPGLARLCVRSVSIGAE